MELSFSFVHLNVIVVIDLKGSDVRRDVLLSMGGGGVGVAGYSCLKINKKKGSRANESQAKESRRCKETTTAPFHRA